MRHLYPSTTNVFILNFSAIFFILPFRISLASVQIISNTPADVFPHNRYRFARAADAGRINRWKIQHTKFAGIKIKDYFCNRFSGCSSVRFRVRVWGACGRWFESSHPDKNTSSRISNKRHETMSQTATQH